MATYNAQDGLNIDQACISINQSVFSDDVSPIKKNKLNKKWSSSAIDMTGMHNNGL